jgi:protein TonB
LLSKSNVLNFNPQWLHHPNAPWLLSGLFHGLLAAAIASMFVQRSPRTESLDITVIESPKAGPTALNIAKPEPKKEAPKPRSVFGVSRKSLTADAQDTAAPDIKAGNTVAKAPDQEKLRDDDADSIPIPTEEYLVSEMPSLAQEIRIPYPPDAKQKGIEGPVVMDILIDSQGRVREARLLQGPDESLNQAALAAVKGFMFKPARVQDKPVAVRIRYAYRFVLER